MMKPHQNKTESKLLQLMERHKVPLLWRMNNIRKFPPAPNSRLSEKVPVSPHQSAAMTALAHQNPLLALQDLGTGDVFVADDEHVLEHNEHISGVRCNITSDQEDNSDGNSFKTGQNAPGWNTRSKQISFFNS